MMVIDQILSAKQGLHQGQTVQLNGVELTIGKVQPRSAEAFQPFAFVSYQDAEKTFGVQGIVNFGMVVVEPGASVTAKCRTKAGRRCKRTKDYRKAAAPLKLRLTSFEGKALPVGAKLTIQLTKPGMTGSVRVLTIRKRKKPSTVTRCLPPGTTRPAACS